MLTIAAELMAKYLALRGELGEPLRQPDDFSHLSPSDAEEKREQKDFAKDDGGHSCMLLLHASAQLKPYYDAMKAARKHRRAREICAQGPLDEGKDRHPRGPRLLQAPEDAKLRRGVTPISPKLVWTSPKSSSDKFSFNLKVKGTRKNEKSAAAAASVLKMARGTREVRAKSASDVFGTSSLHHRRK